MLHIKKRVIAAVCITLAVLFFMKSFWISKSSFEWEMFVIISVVTFLFAYKISDYIADFETVQFKSKSDIFFLIIFFAFLFVPTIHIDNSLVSEKENRYLYRFPSLVIDGKLNYGFGKEFNNWFSDRFFLRDFLISIYDKKYLFMQEFETTNVIRGKDGWLFFGIKESRESYMNKKLFTIQDLENIDKYLSDIDRYCKENGKTFYFIIPPDKSKVYGEYYTDLIRQTRPTGKAEQLIGYINEHSKVKALYLKDFLVSKKGDKLLYYKNDTHWNELGAYYGYVAIIDLLKKQYPNLKTYKVTKYKEIDYYGDLDKVLAFNRMESKNSEKYLVPNVYDAVANCQYIDRSKSGKILSLKCNNSNKPLNLVYFGDSFSERLDKYIAESFNTFKVYRTFDVRKNLLNEADIVILEVIERELPYIVNKEFY